jgi:hypothetical protein
MHKPEHNATNLKATLPIVCVPEKGGKPFKVMIIQHVPTITSLKLLPSQGQILKIYSAKYLWYCHIGIGFCREQHLWKLVAYMSFIYGLFHHT